MHAQAREAPRKPQAPTTLSPRGRVSPRALLASPEQSARTLPDIPRRPSAQDLGGTQCPPTESSIIRTWSGSKLRVDVEGPSLERPEALPPPAALEHGRSTASNGPVLRSERSRVFHLVMCMILFQVIFICDFLGLSSDVSHVQKCSTLYWVFLFAVWPIVTLATVYGLFQIRQAEEDACVPAEQRRTKRTLLFAVFFALATGCIAGLLGLGGGELMVPMLLFLGMDPSAAAATSGFMVFFATSTNVVHYAVANTLEPFNSWAIAVGLLAFFGALCGLKLRYSKTVQERIYLVVFLLVGLLLSSCGLLAVRNLILPAIHGKMEWWGKGFC